jgi:hypothetical protein
MDSRPVSLRLVVLLLAVPSTLAGALAGAQSSGHPSLTPAPLITHASCVEATHRLLGGFIGEFDVRAVYGHGVDARDTTTADARFTWALGGCLVREHFSGRRDGVPYEYEALWGTSGSAAHPIQRVFAHSQHGLLGLSEGGWSAAADTLTIGDSAFVRGRWIYERYVVSRPGPTGFVTIGRRSEDGGRSWFETSRARFTPRPRSRGARSDGRRQVPGADGATSAALLQRRAESHPIANLPETRRV